jgi:probable biosynthetic protein (TIGR04098 family)
MVTGDAITVAVRAEDAKLEMIQEHEGSKIRSDIKRLSRSQFVSIHGVKCEGAPCATVEMISVFLRRSEPKNNHSAIRASIPCDEYSDESPETHPLVKESRAGQKYVRERCVHLKARFSESWP